MNVHIVMNKLPCTFPFWKIHSPGKGVSELPWHLPTLLSLYMYRGQSEFTLKTSWPWILEMSVYALKVTGRQILIKIH